MKSIHSQRKRALHAVLIVLLLSAVGTTKSFAQPQGALNGLFSVSDSTQVYFSRGNLQYRASTNTWRFAQSQWNYVGSGNTYMSSSYSGWIDLFGWGTSGYNHGATCYQPWSTSNNGCNYYAYANPQYNLYDQTGKADWGYNPIYVDNITIPENSGWRTLTSNEWIYVFDTRSTVSGIRYAKAQVNGVKGVILLPNNWSDSIYPLNNFNTSDAGYTSNTINATGWQTYFETNGAVFLPAAANRGWDNLNGVPKIFNIDEGFYWTSMAGNYNSNVAYAKIMSFGDWFVWTNSSISRGAGCSVRLVCDIETTTYTIGVSANPAEGGMVSGGGTYDEGSTCTVTATANSGYTFANWTENDTVVSSNASYSFTVTGNRNLVANFSDSSQYTNHWTPITGTQYNMIVNGIILIDGVEQTSPAYEVGAFCGNECRGSALAEYFPPTSQYIVALTIVSNVTSGETISFRLYDHALGIECSDLNCLSTVAFQNLLTVGSMEDWYEIAFSNDITVSTSLVTGWNWWSTGVDVTPSEGLTMLENSLGNKGLMIISQNSNVQNYYPNLGYNYWFGPLSDIEVENGYKIQVSGAVDAVMTGPAVNPENHPITIANGWNWIGYPLTTEQNISSALANFTPSANDIITGQSVSSTYYADYGWFPSINLVPGNSYLYNSKSTTNKTLVYTAGRSNERYSETEKQHYWENDVRAYPDNTIVIATVEIDGIEQRNEELELGAFVDGECRGCANISHFAPLDRYYAVLTVKGLDGEHVEFRLIDKDSGQMYGNSKTSLTFKENLVAGSLDSPMEVLFQTTKDDCNEALLYPNPTNAGSSFSIVVPEGETATGLVITNVMGNVVRNNIGLASLSEVEGLSDSGIYLIKVICASGNVYHGKLVVK